MKRILLALLLISPASFADWGDVYYCQMTSLVATDADGTVKKYMLEKFQFKLDEEKNALVFGQSGIFKDFVMDVEGLYPPIERWRGNSITAKMNFTEGKFFYAHVSSNNVDTITANCDKF